MSADLNLANAIEAGVAACNRMDHGYDDRRDVEAILAAGIPHVLAAIAQMLEAEKRRYPAYSKSWHAGVGDAIALVRRAAENRAPGGLSAPVSVEHRSTEDGHGTTVPSLQNRSEGAQAITVPWESEPDGHGDTVKIDRSRSAGEYFIASAATYMTPEALRGLGHACLAIAELPAPEALPPRGSGRPRRSTQDGVR